MIGNKLGTAYAILRFPTEGIYEENISKYEITFEIYFDDFNGSVDEESGMPTAGYITVKSTTNGEADPDAHYLLLAKSLDE